MFFFLFILMNDLDTERDELGLKDTLEKAEQDLNLHRISPNERPNELKVLLEEVCQRFCIKDDCAVNPDFGSVLSMPQGVTTQYFIHYDPENPKRKVKSNEGRGDGKRIVPAFLCCRDLMIDGELITRYGVFVVRNDSMGKDPHFYEQAFILSACGSGHLRTNISFVGESDPVNTSLAMDEMQLAVNVTRRMAEVYGEDGVHFLVNEMGRHRYFMGEKLQRPVSVEEAFDGYVARYANGAKPILMEHKPELIRELHEHFDHVA